MHQTFRPNRGYLVIDCKNYSSLDFGNLEKDLQTVVADGDLYDTVLQDISKIQWDRQPRHGPGSFVVAVNTPDSTAEQNHLEVFTGFTKLQLRDNLMERTSTIVHKRMSEISFMDNPTAEQMRLHYESSFQEDFKTYPFLLIDPMTFKMVKPLLWGTDCVTSNLCEQGRQERAGKKCSRELSSKRLKIYDILSA